MKNIIAIICALALLCQMAQAKIKAVWSTETALPGEKVVLALLNERDNASPLQMKQIKPGELTNGRFLARGNNYFNESIQDANGKTTGRIEVYLMLVEVGRSGKVECDDIEVTFSAGNTEQVKVPALTVLTTATVKWRDIDANMGSNAAQTKFGTMWVVSPQKDYYTGQNIHAHIKLLLPLNFVQLALPTIVAPNVKADSFRSPLGGIPGAIIKQWLPFRERIVLADKQQWIACDFVVNLIPYADTTAQGGNYDVHVSIPCVFQVEQRESGANFVFTSLHQESITLNLPKLELARPLPFPPNAPADFTDLTGQYRLKATTDDKELRMNEFVTVKLTVEGSGNLELMPCPKPQDNTHWKLETPTRNYRYSATGEITAVEYSQLMRPTAEVNGIPSFAFSYFNPETGDFQTAETAVIDLPWTATDTEGSGQVITEDGPPPAGTVPVAELTDIYHFLPNAEEGGNGAAAKTAKEWWYLLYLPGVGILLWLLGKALAVHIKAGSRQRAIGKEWAAISREKDNTLFLKKTGAFIESHLAAAAKEPEMQAILHKRDTEVFRPNGTAQLNETERAGMIKTIKKALSKLGALAAVFCCWQAQQATAADEAMDAYQAGQYTRSLQLLEKELEAGTDTRNKGELLYNIGNCHYRLNHPGQAALYYAKALTETPGLAEAKANLGFIQRKEGAVLPQKNAMEEVFTYLSMPQLWLAMVICTALLLLSIALAILLKERLKHTLRICIGISLVLSLLCLADYIYYSTRPIPDITATPPQDLAYIVQNTTARTAPLEQAGSVINLTPSTPVRILNTRGHHYYIETFTGVRGWIPTEAATRLTTP